MDPYKRILAADPQKILDLFLGHGSFILLSDKQRRRLWNRWRRIHRHPLSFQGITMKNIDRSDYQLEGAILAEATLDGAALNDCNLVTANLSKASAIRVDFSSADMTGANLSGANLQGADFEAAYLYKAIIKKADIRGFGGSHAIFNYADLRYADFSSASSHTFINPLLSSPTSIWLVPNARGEIYHHKPEKVLFSTSGLATLFWI